MNIFKKAYRIWAAKRRIRKLDPRNAKAHIDSAVYFSATSGLAYLESLEFTIEELEK